MTATDTLLRILSTRSALWFGALLVVIAMGFGRSLLTHGVSLERTMDSPGYEAQATVLNDLPATLSAIRTPLYPMFLRFSLLFGRDYRAVPLLQYAIFGAAAVLLFASCRLAGFRPWESFVVSAPFGFATVLDQYGATIAPEVIATSLAVVAFAVSLIIAAGGCGWTRNAALSAAVFCACLARPSFLYLVVLCPVAIALVTPGIRASVAVRRMVRDFGLNLVSTGVPLLCYAALRLAVVGNFGIVSFGGIALSGLATGPVFLSATIPSRLESQEMRGLATAILAQRAIAVAADSGKSPLDWEPGTGESMFQNLSASFNASVWEVSVPAAQRYYHAPPVLLLNPDWVLINDKLGRLSVLTIRQNMSWYLKWVGFSVKHAFLTVFSYERSARIAIPTCLTLLLVLTVRTGLRGRPVASAGKRPANFFPIVAVQAAAFGSVVMVAIVKRLVLAGLYPLVIGLCCLAISVRHFWKKVVQGSDYPTTAISRAQAYLAFAVLFFAGGAILTSLVEEPIRRYIIAISPLLPGAILVVSIRWVIALLPARITSS